MQLTVVAESRPKTLDLDVAGRSRDDARYQQMCVVPGVVSPVGTASNILLHEMSRDVISETAACRAAQPMTARARLFIQVYVQTWSVAEAAKRSGTSRAAHYKRMERDPRYKAEFEDSEEIIRDTIREEIRRRAIDTSNVRSCTEASSAPMKRGNQCI